jgi:hypothetical protein
MTTTKRMEKEEINVDDMNGNDVTNHRRRRNTTSAKERIRHQGDGANILVAGMIVIKSHGRSIVN